MICRLALFLLILSNNALASSVYTVGVEDIDYTPIFSSMPAPENFKGFARDLLDKFAESEKIEFKYVPLPIKRFLLVFQSGNLDFAFPDNPKWNLEEKKNLKVTYSTPLITFQDAVFVKPEKLGLGIGSLKVLGTLSGFTPWKFQSLIDAGKIKLESANTPETLVNMALLGRVDGINMARQVVQYHLKKKERPNDLVSDPKLMPLRDSYYHFSTLKHPEVIKKLNIFIKKESVFIRELKKKYGL